MSNPVYLLGFLLFSSLFASSLHHHAICHIFNSLAMYLTMPNIYIGITPNKQGMDAVFQRFLLLAEYINRESPH